MKTKKLEDTMKTTRMIILMGVVGSIIAIIVITTWLNYAPMGQNLSIKISPTDTNLRGFEIGIFHGLTILPSLIISLFGNSPGGIYATNNNGLKYDLGFVLGILLPILIIFGAYVYAFACMEKILNDTKQALRMTKNHD